MFNPEKDFGRKIIETLGKDGESISALSKDLESKGIKIHRLILTGYLRAMADMNILREKEIPPSKIYIPIHGLSDNVYQSIEKGCRKMDGDQDSMILYCLNRILKRPVFDSELRMAGVMRKVGTPADEQITAECKKHLRRNGNIVPGEVAFLPTEQYPEEYSDILTDLILETKDARHLVMSTKQTRLV